jgi:hypothetical protein
MPSIRRYSPLRLTIPASDRELVQIASYDLPSKIDAWAKYATLSTPQRLEMHCLVKVGNAFAHRPRAASFDVEPIGELMQQLAESMVERKPIAPNLSAESTKGREWSSPRNNTMHGLAPELRL